MRIADPLQSFLVHFVPGCALASVVSALSVENSPSLAPIILMTLSFAAFAIAVARAAAPRKAGGRRGRFHAMEALLDLRRNRLRYSVIFAAAGATLTVLIMQGLTMLGLDAPMEASLILFVGVVVVLLVSAWLLIGEAACSNDAIRRALIADRERKMQR